MSEAFTTTDLQQVADFLDPHGAAELPCPDTCQRVGKWIRRAIAGGAIKCDGNHGGPRCGDPECWNDDQAAEGTTP